MYLYDTDIFNFIFYYSIVDNLYDILIIVCENGRAYHQFLLRPWVYG